MQDAGGELGVGRRGLPAVRRVGARSPTPWPEGETRERLPLKLEGGLQRWVYRLRRGIESGRIASGSRGGRGGRRRVCAKRDGGISRRRVRGDRRMGRRLHLSLRYPLLSWR